MRKITDEKIIKSDDLLNALFNAVEDTLIFALDKEYRYVAFNENHRREMEKVYKADIKIGRCMLDYITIPEVKLLAKASYERVLKGESFTEIRNQPGYDIRYEFHWSPISTKDNRILGINVFARDITQRRKSEDALRESEERFSVAFKTSPYAYVIAAMEDGAIIEVNDAATAISGFTRKEMLGTSTLTLNLWVHEEDRRRMVAALRDKGLVERMETQLRGKNGNIITVLFFARAVRLGQRSCVISIIEDITERKKAEEVQMRTASLLKATLESTADGILVVDPSGRVTIFNAKFGELWRIPPRILDTHDDDTLLAFILGQLKDPDAFMAKVKKLYARPHEESFDTLEFKDGRVFERYSRPQRMKGEIAGRVWSFRDITERIKMETELQKTQKLDALGVLAGGIAHDFNNLLTGIFGFVDLALFETKEPRTKEYLESTLSSMSRAKALTLQLLTFAKGGAPVRKITPLIPFIRETAQFALCGSNISGKYFLAEDLRQCNIDKNQIGQVIDNIVINAKQAMPNGGEIEIAAVNIWLEEKEHPLLPQGAYVKISIKDSGIGIPKDVLPRIFDPFYTTKTQGHGLGLATCYSIIKRHGGAINVESEPGKGSTFHLYLPASEEAAAKDAAAVTRHRGSGTIVVADDEAAVRNVLRKMLESLGYAVVCKSDGKEAVDFYVSETGENRRIAAMIFDLTIPGGMGGIEAVNHVRELDKEIAVFVISGYSDDPVAKNPLSYGFTASISKPFTMTELSEMLNKYLKH